MSDDGDISQFMQAVADRLHKQRLASYLTRSLFILGLFSNGIVLALVFGQMDNAFVLPCLAILLIILWILSPRASKVSEETCSLIDTNLNLKERSLSWFFLKFKEPADSPQLAIVSKQMDHLLSPDDLENVIPVIFSLADRLLLSCGIVLLFCSLLLDYALRPLPTPAAPLTPIQQLLQNPELPPELKPHLERVQEALSSNQDTQTLLEAITTTEQIAQRILDSGILSSTQLNQQEISEPDPRDSNNNSSAEPTPTPTPTPANKDKKSETTEKKNQQKTDNSTNKESEQQKKQQSSSSDQQKNSENSQEQSDQQSTKSSQQNKDQQDKSTEDPKTGKQNQQQDGGSGKEEGNAGQNQGTKGKESKENEEGGEAPQTQPESAKSESKSQGGSPEEKQQKESQANSPEMSQQQQQQQQQQSASQNEMKDQASQQESDPKGEKDTQQKTPNQKKSGDGDKKENGEKPLDTSGNSPSEKLVEQAKQELNKLKQSLSDQLKQPPTQKDSKKEDMDPGSGSAPEGIALPTPKDDSKKQEKAKENQGEKDTEAKEIQPSNLGEKPGDGDKLPQNYRDEKLHENQDKINPNAGGQTTGFQLNKDPVNSSLKVENVKIPKPQLSKDNEAQRIPLEYQDYMK